VEFSILNKPTRISVKKWTQNNLLEGMNFLHLFVINAKQDRVKVQIPYAGIPETFKSSRQNGVCILNG
jgi:hypothetical protein